MMKFNKSNVITLIILVLTIVSLLVLAGITIVTLRGENGLLTRASQAELEDDSKNQTIFSYVVLDNTNKTNIKILITANSTYGLEYIESPDGNKMYANGLDKIAIDYIVSENTDYIFKAKTKYGTEISEVINVNNESINETTLGIEPVTNASGYKAINVQKKIDIDYYDDIYYKLKEEDDWIKGTKFSIVDYDYTQNGLVNEDGTMTLFAKIINTKNNNQVTVSKKINIDTTNVKESIEGESLLKVIGENNLKTGNYEVTVSDEIYNLKVYNIDGSAEINADTTFGVEDDVGKADGYAKNMIVLKVNGDLTIDEGVTLTPYASSGGYGGPKGMMVYCTGKLTNNGTISMTARGAYAEGQNVYLWKNEDESYEYVPAVGAEGGKSVYNGNAANGITGDEGTARQTGGGRKRIFKSWKFWKRRQWYIIFWRNRRWKWMLGNRYIRK